MSSTQSGEMCGMSLARLEPSLCGKLKSMCELECFLSLASVSGGGVPMTLWILLIWSSSLS